MIKIERIPAGVYAANCYIVSCDETQEGYVIDPGGSHNKILEYIEANQIQVKGIVLTHGHGDHHIGVLPLNHSLSVDIMVHKGDVEMIESAELNLSNSMMGGPSEFKASRVLEEGDELTFGEHSLRVIHTPGHTKGGICLLVDRFLLTGDTLFYRSYGRTDLYGGDQSELYRSITQKIFNLDEALTILPGHGGPSLIKDEKRVNPIRMNAGDY